MSDPVFLKTNCAKLSEVVSGGTAKNSKLVVTEPAGLGNVSVLEAEFNAEVLKPSNLFEQFWNGSNTSKQIKFRTSHLLLRSFN